MLSWPEQWESQLEQVNSEVNLFPYKHDTEKYNRDDFWTEITEDGGDCEDYSIAKLHRLKKLGWPVESLHLACCYVETGEYHAVLVVETPKGAFMLDNRNESPVSLTDLSKINYKPDIIQAVGGDPSWNEWIA